LCEVFESCNLVGSCLTMASSLSTMLFSFLFIVFGAVLRGGVVGMEPVRIDEHQPLSRIALHRMSKNLMSGVTISASPSILGKNVSNPNSCICSKYVQLSHVSNRFIAST
jgi:hypothetical protein